MKTAIIFFFIPFLMLACDDTKKTTTPDVYYELTTILLPQEGGRVVVTNAATGIVIEHIDSILIDTKIKLKAAPSEGYKLSEWQTNNITIGTTDSLSITMNSDKNITAVFRKEGGTPVGTYGQLSIEGKHVVDANKTPIQLRGMSLFWSQWIGKYWNADVVNWLANDWEVSIIRASMGVDENGGYIHNATEKKKVETVVEAAIKEGIYVIIDWHSHHAENYEDEAVAFFTEMAKKYGEYPNVLYEIYNEPLDISWVGTLKPYANKVIEAIRKEDPDNIVLVGTPRWCQNIDVVIGSTIDDDNTAYVFHFYASEVNHYNTLFTKAQKAIDAGVPVFVSEWGVSEASGNGNFNQAWTEEWVQFMDDNNLSWCNWSVADKAETSAALLPGANINGGWDQSELNSSGRYIRDLLRSHKGYSNPR